MKTNKQIGRWVVAGIDFDMTLTVENGEYSISIGRHGYLHYQGRPFSTESEALRDGHALLKRLFELERNIQRCRP